MSLVANHYKTFTVYCFKAKKGRRGLLSVDVLHVMAQETRMPHKNDYFQTSSTAFRRCSFNYCYHSCYKLPRDFEEENGLDTTPADRIKLPCSNTALLLLLLLIIIIIFLTLGRYIPEGFKKLKKVI